MAGIAHPQVEQDGRMDRASSKLLEEKIALVLNACAPGSRLVLGAWGCGVYGCPPLHVATIFRDTIAKLILLCVFVVVLTFV
jgi:uncharacterized protein (TIGR02452 family)